MSHVASAVAVLPLRRAGRRGGARLAGDADGAAVDGVAAGRVVPPGLAPAHGRAAPGHLRGGEETEIQGGPSAHRLDFANSDLRSAPSSA